MQLHRKNLLYYVISCMTEKYVYCMYFIKKNHSCRWIFSSSEQVLLSWINTFYVNDLRILKKNIYVSYCHGRISQTTSNFQFNIKLQISLAIKKSTYICYSSTELLKLDSFFSSSSNIVKEAKGHIIYLKSHSNSTELSILPLFANCQERRYENCHRHIVEIASNFCKRPLRGFVSSSNSIKDVFGEMCVCKFAFFVKKYYREI